MLSSSSVSSSTPRAAWLTKWKTGLFSSGSSRSVLTEDDSNRLDSNRELESAIEALHREKQAALIQRVQRGRAVRKQSSNLAHATALSQRQWRTQRVSVAIVRVQIATKVMLAQRRQALEAGLNLQDSITEGGRWHHERSANALKSKLAHGDAALGLQPHGRKGSSIGVRTVANALTGIVERNESKQAYQAETDARAVDSGFALVEHCGWLLKQGRAFQSWRMRWAMVQAGCLWYFKDDGRRELLGRMALASTTIVAERDARQFCIRSEQRVLRLIAADETEARAWIRVLLRCVREGTATELVSQRAETLQVGRSGARAGMPQTVADLHELLLLLVPASPKPMTLCRLMTSSGSTGPLAGAAAGASGGGTDGSAGGCGCGSGSGATSTTRSSTRITPFVSGEAGLPTPGSSGVSFPALSAAQEEALSVLLLTIQTFGEPLEGVARLLQQRYDRDVLAEAGVPDPSTPTRVWEQWALMSHGLTRRRIAYVLLRWAQLHPHHFAAEGAHTLRGLWQQAAADGYLAELGLRMAHTKSAPGGETGSGGRAPGGNGPSGGPPRGDASTAADGHVAQTAEETATQPPPTQPSTTQPSTTQPPPTQPSPTLPSPTLPSTTQPPPTQPPPRRSMRPRRSTAMLDGFYDVQRFSEQESKVERELAETRRTAPARLEEMDNAEGGMLSPRPPPPPGQPPQPQPQPSPSPSQPPPPPPAKQAPQSPQPAHASSSPSTAPRPTPQLESSTAAGAMPSALLLPADTGVWRPFARPERANFALAGVREIPISALSVEQAHQVLSILSPGLAQLGHRPHRGLATLAREASKHGGRGSVGPSTVPPPSAALQPALRPSSALSERVYAVLSRPLEADSVGAEHWLSVEPVQIARYLTLSDERLYQSVGHGHLLSYVWGHVSAEGATEGASKQPLLQLTQRFNEVASIVKSAIIGTSMLATRTQLVAHLVAVGVELRRLANFNSVMALIAALGSAAVHRLSGTKQKLDRKSRAAWESLTELMAHDGAHRQYRAALAAARRSPPYVPYLGIHLTDLTFVGDGNKDVVDGMINVGKRQQVHAIVATALSGKTHRYSLAALPGIARLLEAVRECPASKSVIHRSTVHHPFPLTQPFPVSSRHRCPPSPPPAPALPAQAPRLSEDELYRRSLEIEPRGLTLADLEKRDAALAVATELPHDANRAGAARAAGGDQVYRTERGTVIVREASANSSESVELH